jgi:hypothetical protein
VFLWRLHIAKQKQTTADRPTTIYCFCSNVCYHGNVFDEFFCSKSATRNTHHGGARLPNVRCVCVRVSCLPLGERASAGATDRFSVLRIVCDLWSHYLPLLISNWELDPQTKLLIRHVCLLSPFRSLRFHSQFSLYSTHIIKLMCKLLLGMGFLDRFLGQKDVYFRLFPDLKKDNLRWFFSPKRRF